MEIHFSGLISHRKGWKCTPALEKRKSNEYTQTYVFLTHSIGTGYGAGQIFRDGNGMEKMSDTK